MQVIEAEPTRPHFGMVREYSLYHVLRLVKRGEAYTDSLGRVVRGIPDVDPDACMIGRVRFGAALYPRVKTAAEHAADQRAIDLWPMIPRVSGRPLQDFLDTQQRRSKGEPEMASRELARIEDGAEENGRDMYAIALKSLETK